MANLSLSYTLVNGTVADATEVMANYNDIVNYINARNTSAADWDNLSVSGSSVFKADTTFQDASANVVLFVDESTRRVGIGTATPTVELDLTRNLPGVNTGIMFYNSSINALSGTNLKIQTNEAAAGDPFVTFTVLGQTSYSIGIDNSSSDLFTISASSALGTSNVLTLDGAGIVGLTGPLRLANGSQTAPAYSFTAGTGDGMYRLGTAWVGIATGGTNRLHVNSSGLVGIGPTSATTGLQISNATVATVTLDDLNGRVSIIEGVDAANAGMRVGTTSNHDLLFITGNTTRTSIDNNGNHVIHIDTSDNGLTLTDDGSNFNPLIRMFRNSVELIKIAGTSSVGNVFGGGGELRLGSAMDVSHAKIIGATFNLVLPGLTHGLTTLAPTDVYSRFESTGVGGGLNLNAVTATDVTSMFLRGTIGVTDPTDTTPAIIISGAKSNGATSRTNLAALETVLQIANAGTVISTWLGNGNFGIGTATPAFKLDVNGDISTGAGNKYTTFTGNDLSIDTPAGRSIILKVAGSMKVFMDNAGNVGIGVNTPANLLHLFGGANVPRIRFEDSANRTWYLGSASTNSFVLYDAVVAANRLVVDGNGYLGLGISSPLTNLDILEGPGSNFAGIGIRSNTGTKWYITAGQASFSNAVLSIGTAIDGNPPKMQFSNTGNVGIGTSAIEPFGKLHVRTAASGSAGVLTSGDEGVFENSGHSGISVLAGTSSSAAIHFGDSGSSIAGFVSYDNNTDTMNIGASTLSKISANVTEVRLKNTTSVWHDSSVDNFYHRGSSGLWDIVFKHRDIATGGVLFTGDGFSLSPNPGTVSGVVANNRGFSIASDAATVSSTVSVGLAVAVGRVDPAVVIRNNAGPALVIEVGTFRYAVSPTNGYVLTSDASGNASWAPNPTSPWTVTGSDIYFAGGNNVGINQTSPSVDLHVGGGSGTPEIRIEGGATLVYGYEIYNGATEEAFFRLSQTGAALEIGTTSGGGSNPIEFSAGSSNLWTMTKSGTSGFFSIDTSDASGHPILEFKINTSVRTYLECHASNDLRCDGHYSPNADNSYDFGISGSRRWKNTYLINAVTVESHSSTKVDVVDIPDDVEIPRGIQFRREDSPELFYGFLSDGIPEEIRRGPNKTGVGLDAPIGILCKKVRELQEEVAELKARLN